MRILTERQLAACVHPGERPRFILALIVVGPGFLLSILALLAIWLGPLFQMDAERAVGAVVIRLGIVVLTLVALMCIVWFVKKLLETDLRANAAEVTTEALPELEETIRRACRSLGYPRERVTAFLRDQSGYDAQWWFGLVFLFLWAVRTRDILIINSTLAESAYQYNAPGELEFVVANHVGWARQRSARMIFQIQILDIARRLPVFAFFVRPYLRALVYTGDRVALAATNDLQSALDALSALIVGKDLASMVALAGWLQQHERLKGSFLSFLVRAFRNKPHPVDRIANVLCFARTIHPDQFQRVMGTLPVLHRHEVEMILADSRHNG